MAHLPIQMKSQSFRRSIVFIENWGLRHVIFGLSVQLTDEFTKKTLLKERYKQLIIGLGRKHFSNVPGILPLEV